ncbi:MAG: hypothetical protein U9P70_01790 [Patescibacteria group bacterium]|nr:hypothetical protein [Patescibacteria group bacterium]
MSTNSQKQQAGFALIGLVIAVVIIIILFICSDNTFFSREKDIVENKAIYEEAEKDLEEIKQKNDGRQKMIKDIEDIEQIYDEGDKKH